MSRGAYEERSGTYTPFVRRSGRWFSREKPTRPRADRETSKRYFFLLIGALLGLGALAFVMIAVRTPIDALPYANLIKFGVILLMLPMFWRWVLKVLPRGVALHEIPERALPPESGG